MYGIQIRQFINGEWVNLGAIKGCKSHKETVDIQTKLGTIFDESPVRTNTFSTMKDKMITIHTDMGPIETTVFPIYDPDIEGDY